jgi:hypothetical protein
MRSTGSQMKIWSWFCDVKPFWLSFCVHAVLLGALLALLVCVASQTHMQLVLLYLQYADLSACPVPWWFVLAI